MPARILCAAILLSSVLCWISKEAGTATHAAPATQNPPAQKSPTPKESVFTESVASQLMDQIAAGLTSHSQKRVLAAFNLAKMTDGPLFRQQVGSFMAQTGNIRVHYNLLQVTMEGEQGVISVQMEMEADPREAGGMPLRKQAQLRLVAESSEGGWKFVDIQPRSFFSTQP